MARSEADDRADGERPRADAPPALQARGLVLRREGRAVLDGLDLDVREGVVGLYGPRGAGKSSLADLTLGLVRRVGGDLAVAGIDPGRRALAARAAVGVVPQRVALYPFLDALSLERLAADLYPRWHKKRFFGLLSRWKVPTRRPVERVAPLGRARLALAVALSHRPDLLVIDEPEGLDAAEQAALQHDALAHRRDVPALLLTGSPHRLEGQVDRLAVLSGGRLRFDGPPAALTDRVRRLTLRPGTEPPPFPAGITRLRWRTGADDAREGTLWVRLEPDARGAAAWATLGGLPDVVAIATPGLEEAALALVSD